MHAVDAAIVLGYLTLVVSVGLSCRGNQESVRDYFTAQNGFRGLLGMVVVGLSIGATLFSGLSFVAFPSIVYTYGVTSLALVFCYPVMYVMMRYWFLPRYLAAAGNGPYAIIEARLGRPVRLLASAMFVAMRLSWMAALIYAPVVVLMASLGLGREWFWPIVLSIGVSSTVYTVAGGIRGVIITDALQMVMIVAVLGATILYMIGNNSLSTKDTAQFLMTHTGLLHFNWSSDLTVAMTVLGMALGGGVQDMSSYAADQMSLQRYLAAGDAKTAGRALGMCFVSTAIVLLMLAAVGLALGSWYHLHPDPALPQDADRVFPYFVATQLPVGFVGMIVAAILAATMSSMTSGINALSGSLLTDFVPLEKTVEPRLLLRRARQTSAGIGLVATGAAGLVEHLGTLFNIMTVFYGIFFGPLLACMICAICSWRVPALIMVAAMLLGCGGGIVVGMSPIANLWVALISGAITLTIAGLAWRWSPSPPPETNLPTGLGDLPRRGIRS